MYRLVSLNIDDLLFSGPQAIPERFCHALQSMFNQDIIIVFCSSSPLGAVLDFINRLPLKNSIRYIVACNGAWIYDLHKGCDIWFDPLTNYDVTVLVDAADEICVSRHFYSKEFLVTDENPVSSYSAYEAKLLAMEVFSRPVDSLKGESLIKMAMVGDKEYLDLVLPLLPEKILKNYEMIRTAATQFSIVQQGCNKGKALNLIAMAEGIKLREIVAVGKRTDDISMLNTAGLKLAVSDASIKLKQHASKVLQHNGVEGLQEALERYVLDI